MSRKGSLGILLLSLMILMGCSRKEDYVYPPVALEFLTAKVGNDGRLSTILTDRGEQYEVTEDRTGFQGVADKEVRIIANYEVLPDNGGASARVYALRETLSLDPVLASSLENGVKTDPAEVVSIWMGREYLNIILSLMAKDRIHRFHFVEEQVSEAADARMVKILLYHDADGDMEAFSKRAYLSIPLRKYLVNIGTKKLLVGFEYYRRDRSGALVKESRYANPGFEYIPNKD